MHLGYKGKDLLSERIVAFGGLIGVFTACGLPIIFALPAAMVVTEYLSKIA